MLWYRLAGQVFVPEVNSLYPPFDTLQVLTRGTQGLESHSAREPCTATATLRVSSFWGLSDLDMLDILA